MNLHLLIDSIVRQTTVLIAQLATAAGTRAPLAHTANQVFLDLAAELRAQGLGHKVIADMFGLALRTYHGKVRRLSESQTFRGASLWAVVFEYIQKSDSVTRPALLQRFHYDDEVSVRGVVSDLVDSGLVSRSGRGDFTTYRAVAAGEAGQTSAGRESLEHLVWVAVHRFGPLTVEQLEKTVALPQAELSAALERLREQGRVQREGAAAGGWSYQSEHCVIGLEDPAGWEAAVFDHYQAVVTAIAHKLAVGKSQARLGEAVGGSTYHYDVWEGHPHYLEVEGHLAELRRVSVALREKVERYNSEHSPPSEEDLHKFTAYVGQSVLRPEGEQ